MIGILLRYRRTHLVLAGVVVFSTLGMVLSGRVIDIDLNPNEPPVLLPMADACGIVCAILAATALRPRFWEWERTAGGCRTAAPAATAAFVGISSAPLVAAISTLTLELHPSAEQYGITTVGELLAVSALNVTFIAALVFALSPLAGPLLAGATGLLVWLGTAVLNSLESASRHYTPTSGLRFPLPDTWPHYPLIAALVLTLLAVTVHARTRGSTSFAQRLRQ
ncbi:hypothetical protein [Saccharomonospora viridis]|jgi:hypothetical protein|uniref:Uncharacterized protein n=2 Tax=Saccharomonospora viridis TaxID=1852 RepID=C7MWR2_SACVD|nr:hypothetical protein [Saccharomonospora viridis]ACU97166.1 hypothetical protein Svir_21560 [Saccharomonospora viridis DSM 43017]KHF43421.1 hypothetical protein MINT15_36230 [Saccharomonospora viridis]SFO79325.1 hypothetical protein SAMN02982918_0179 [Saccharomonospora viridis]